MAQDYQFLLDEVKKNDDRYAEAIENEARAATIVIQMEAKLKALQEKASELKTTNRAAKVQLGKTKTRIGDNQTAQTAADDTLKQTLQALFDAAGGAASGEEALARIKEPVADLETAARKAEGNLCERKDLETRLSKTEETIRVTGEELSEINDEIEAVKGTLQTIHKEYSKAAKAREEALKDRDEARTAFQEALKARPAPYDSEVIRIISGRPGTVPHDFLTITTRDLKLARPVRIALEKLGEEFSKSRDRDAVRDACVKAGIGSQVEAITRRVNRQRLPDMRREVLARVYHEILFNRLADSGGSLATARARDTSGIAQSVLADLERSGGPLDKFAEILAEQSAGEMGLDAPPRSVNHAVPVARLRGGL